MTVTTTSRIVWPRAALAGCVFCTILRDTRGVVLDHAQRFNFFPASPMCWVSWLLEGDCYLVDGHEMMERPWQGTRLPALAFSGAQLGPLMSWNPAETCAVAIAFYPDAFSAMTGLDLGPFTGRIVSAGDALPDSILETCRSLFNSFRSEGIDKSLSTLEGKLEALWSNARSDKSMPMRWLKDWTRSLAIKAAYSGAGRSTRQAARRIKSWTGISERDLKSLGQTEQLYGLLHAAAQKGSVDWAGLASASGFADQAHMIRRVRTHTGFTPEQLRRGARSDEAFWGYRLLGQYFSEPGSSNQ